MALLLCLVEQDGTASECAKIVDGDGDYIEAIGFSATSVLVGSAFLDARQ